MGEGKLSALIALFLLGCAPAGFATTINFDASTNLSLVGTAAPLETGGVRLTDAIEEGSDATPPAGAAWLTDRVPVASGFTVSFAFEMSDGRGLTDADQGLVGGDGLAFVIQNNPYGNHAIGRGAGGMGYMNIWDSLAVEFDTFENLPWYGELNGNHISVQTMGQDPNVPHHQCTDGKLTVPGYETDLPDRDCSQNPSLGSVEVSNPFNNGTLQTATIQYIPGSLSVYLNDNFALSVPLQLDTLFPLDNGAAFIGFTAGTRLSYENHDIVWATYRSPETAPEPSTWILLLSGLGAASLLHGWRRGHSA